MNDDAIFLIYRVDCIAGKPPPTFCRSLGHCVEPAAYWLRPQYRQ